MEPSFESCKRISVLISIFFFYQICLCQPELKLFQPDVISTGDFESHISFTPDGLEAYFVKSAPDFSTWTICVSYLKNNTWTTPAIAPFSGKFNDADPFITKDGKRLYFISNRPIRALDTEQKDLDIWYVERNGNNWGAPVRLDTIINSPANEWYPTEAENGNLYFGSQRPSGLGRCDLYYCQYKDGKYINRENLGENINSEYNEFEPFIFPDESALFFMGFSPRGMGGADLYYSKKKDGKWAKAVNLTELNSKGTEYSPMITHDRKFFFFASTRSTIQSGRQINYDQLKKQINTPGNGLGDIYFITFDELVSLLEKYK